MKYWTILFWGGEAIRIQCNFAKKEVRLAKLKWKVEESSTISTPQALLTSAFSRNQFDCLLKYFLFSIASTSFLTMQRQVYKTEVAEQWDVPWVWSIPRPFPWLLNCWCPLQKCFVMFFGFAPKVCKVPSILYDAKIQAKAAGQPLLEVMFTTCHLLDFL